IKEGACKVIEVIDVAKLAGCLAGCTPLVETGPGYVACVSACFLHAVLSKMVCDLSVRFCEWKCAQPDCANRTLTFKDGSLVFVCPVQPIDPNEIIGPTSFGPERFVGVNQPLEYSTYFENVSNATATATRIEVVNNLDPNLDPRTFRLRTITFG